MEPLRPEDRRRHLSRVRRYARAFYLVWTVVATLLAVWVVLGPRRFALAHGVAAASALWLAGLGAVAVVAHRIRRGEERIQASESFFRALWEHSRDALFLMKGGRFVRCNRAAAELFETAPEDLMGRHPWEVSPPVQPDGRNSREAAKDRIETALAGGSEPFEWRHRTLSGRDIDCEVALGRIDVGGETYLLAAVRDISARKEAEVQRRLLERAVEAAAESVLVTDPDGAILYVNPAFERITGYSREEVLGQNPRILKSGQHDEAFYRELWETITSGEVWRGTFTNRRKDGTLYREEAVIAPVLDGSGAVTAFVAVRRDVTREEQVEERLRLAERMETVGQMASVVAHDFNNLLTSVQGAAEIIARRAGGDGEIAARVQVLRRAVDRGAHLIQRLLSVARREIHEPREVDLGETLGEMRGTVESALREDIRFELFVPAGRLVSRLDPGQLERAILNLAANARDAMPSGGELTIELEEVDLDEAYVAAYPGAAPGAFARISVTDTGVGMDRDTVAKIFEPFFTTKGEAGTGLGLATVYAFAESSGGFVNVYSEPGRGSTFKLYLPLVEGEPTPSGTRPVVDDEEDLPTGSGTVLVVEDDPGVLESVIALVEELGYSVIPAENGEAALRVLEERPLAVDIILTDIVLPGLGGGELAARAAELAPHTVIVFTSGYTENVVHDRFELRPGVIFMEKPYTFRKLAHTLRRALDARKA